MTNVAHTANRVAGSGLRFLFAPQLFSGLKPTKLVMLGFVQIIAQFLATAKLIPDTHRALRPLTVADARLGEVLALAYSNARRPGTRMDQWSVLAATTVLMALLIMMTLYTVGALLIGSAHAAISISFSWGGCSYAAGSLFVSPCSTDMAQQWIDMLLLGATNTWSAQIVSLPVAAGLANMFQTYSMAMLVIAGFLVLYHLLVIIAGTAHEGKFGGRGMNQVWAPIRLVAAIGMLVPLGVNGLNSGQMIVTQVAKWGSGLASNVWMNFANSYAANTGAYIIMPPIPAATTLAKQALYILVCYRGMNSLFLDEIGGLGTPDKSITPTPWFVAPGNKTIRRSWDYMNTMGNANVSDDDFEEAACGAVEMPNPSFVATGFGFQFLTLGSAFSANDSLRADILNAHRNALDAMMADGSPLDQLAQTIYWSADSARTPPVIVQESDVQRFNTAVANYRASLAAGIAAAVTASTAASGMSMANDAMARGWLSAGVWFNSIARVNGMLLDFSQRSPSGQADFKPIIPDAAATRVTTALHSVNPTLDQMPIMAVTGAGTFALAEPDEIAVISNASNGDSSLEFFLKEINTAMTKSLGVTSGSSDEITAGIPAYAQSFRLNTGNPLAELSALGYRLINLTLAATKKLQACARAAADLRMAVNGQGSVEEAKLFSQSACGDDNGSMSPGHMLMSAVTSSLIVAGVTLGFVLPMIPFIRFMFGILTWIMALFETVIAIPVVALAHIKMDGEGLAGPLARTAYLLMLQLFLRPTLMVFGLILALLIFNLMIVALNEFYTQAVRTVEVGGNIGAISGVVYSILYAILAYAFANASFKAIDLVPNQCLQWIGGANQSGGMEAERVTQSFGSSVSSIGSNVASVARIGGRV
jgi:conjugal transfer/type IV secretion protein DotA/TraY